VIIEFSFDFFFQISLSSNESALIEYNKQLNSYANLRDFLMTFVTNFVIAGSNSISLQASFLVQLTQATNQLTRSAVVIITFQCIISFINDSIFEFRRLHLKGVIN
jgi:hypothetical protein